MQNSEYLLPLLRESQPRPISSLFEKLLDAEINIAKGIRETASTSQNHLRDFLAGEHGRDATFPRVLSIKDSDFIGGSFARHVKNWPLDDIDVYLPLDGHELIYFGAGGIRLPYTVVTDNVLARNPLLAARWTSGSVISSAKLINEFAAVLRRHYPDATDVYPNGEAVSIRMKQGETDQADGLGYDVVPCFSLKPDNAFERPFYVIPDGRDGWIRTNPRHDHAVSEQLQNDNGKTFRKAVKLVKFWNTERLGGAISSYYIELAVARAFMERNAKGEYARNLSFAVALAFWAVNQAVIQGDQASWIAQAPPVKPGDLGAVQKLLLATATAFALDAWAKEQANDRLGALQAWKNTFGDKFPETA